MDLDFSLPPWLCLVDACLGLEEFHGAAEDAYDSRTEFPCPFCSEAFDVISLCFHIDKKHPWEYRKGVIAIDYFMRFWYSLYWKNGSGIITNLGNVLIGNCF